jgi:hypothetical protein
MGWALGEVRGNDDLVEYRARLNDVVPRYGTTIAKGLHMELTRHVLLRSARSLN